MKEQYLGDSKDAFKWDYLVFVVSKMRAQCLYIVPMKTSPDKSNEGRTSPFRFPATENIHEFCCHLQTNSRLQEIPKLTQYTEKEYEIQLLKPDLELQNGEKFRSQYFSNIPFKNDSEGVLFLDPDIGFEPNTAKNKHIKYSDINTIWGQIAKGTIVCAFQHSRRMHYPFEQHYKEILRGLEHIKPLSSTAIYWCNKVMFVLLGKSSDQIDNVRSINREYRQNRPVQLIDV